MTFPFPFIPPLLSAASFIGVTSLISTTTTVSWPSGTQSGDLAIAIGAGNSVFAISGWNTIAGDVLNNLPSQSTFAWKQLSASDLASPPSITVPTNGAYYVLIYRGCDGVIKRSTTASATASATASGFTKDQDSRFIIAVAQDRDPNGALSTPPSNFTLRCADISTYFSFGVSDIAASEYDGNSVTATLWASRYGGRLTLLELVESTADPYTMLLLHANGTNGSTVFTDSSSYHRTGTAYDNAQLSTAQAKFGASSILLDGNGDYIEFPASADWALPGDFTLECWYRPNGSISKNDFLLCNVASSGFFVIAGASNLYLYYGDRSTLLLSGAVTWSANTWHHIAVSRTGTTGKLFVNGAQVASATLTTSFGGGAAFRVGNVSTYSPNGNIDEVRVTKGVGRYTAAFTPPIDEF